MFYSKEDAESIFAEAKVQSLTKPVQFMLIQFVYTLWGRRSCDRIVVGFTTTYAISAY
jgi:hypothetical protein